MFRLALQLPYVEKKMHRVHDEMKSLIKLVEGLTANNFMAV